MSSTEIEQTSENLQGLAKLQEVVRSGDPSKLDTIIVSGEAISLLTLEPQLKQNAYFFALENNNEAQTLEMFKFLLSKGVPITHRDSLQQTVLFYAAKDGSVAICDFILSNGVDVNSRDINFQTALFYAAREGKTEVIDVFVKHKADLNLQDSLGQSCLFYAVKEGHADFVKELLIKGAKVGLVDKKRVTPLSLARKLSKKTVADILIAFGAESQVKAKRAPVEKGTSSSFVLCRNGGKSGRTPLSKDELFSLFTKYPDLKELLDISSSDTNWTSKAEEILEKLWEHNAAIIFHNPVDPIMLGIPTYFDVIKNPMDFGTVKSNLKAGKYHDICEFESDVELVFSNCYLFNGRESEVGRMCSEVESLYLELLK